MRLFLKIVGVLVLVAVALVTISYAGTRVTVGRFVREQKDILGQRVVRFSVGGVPELPGKPRVWVYEFPSTELVGQLDVRIYVTPKGVIIGTYPMNLEQRLAGYREAADPTR